MVVVISRYWDWGSRSKNTCGRIFATVLKGAQCIPRLLGQVTC